MSKHFSRGLALTLSLSLCAGLGMGCSDDSEPVKKCTQEDSDQCSTSYASCNAACVADQECLRQCQLDFCGCLDQASCDPPAECQTSGTSDGSTTQPDSGRVADGSSSTFDSMGPVPDNGTTANDTGSGECTAQASQTCSTTLATCTAGCGSDMGCLDNCQDDFCSCMTDAGCEVGDDCHGL